MSDETLQKIFILSGVLFLIGFCVLIYFIVRKAWRSYKKFMFELNDRTKGNSPPSGTSRNDYTYNYDNFTQKQKKDEKPPWEE